MVWSGSLGLWIHVVTGADEIEATLGHPFYVVGRGFVFAVELQAGDWLKDNLGREIEVIKVWEGSGA